MASLSAPEYFFLNFKIFEKIMKFRNVKKEY